MKVAWSHICREAYYSPTWFKLAGVGNILALSPDRPLKFPTPSRLALMLHAPGNSQRRRKIESRIVNMEGDTGETLAPETVSLISIRPGLRLICPALFHLDNARIPAYGDYAFVLSADGEELGRAAFRVIPSAQTTAQGTYIPPSLGEKPLEMIWGHLIGGFEREQFLSGFLDEIVEYYRGPQSTRVPGFNAKGCALAFYFEADGDREDTHELKIAPVQVFEDKPEEPIADPLVRSAKFRPLHPNRVGCQTWQPLDGLGMYPGDYEFRISLDGESVGAIPFSVLKPKKR